MTDAHDTYALILLAHGSPEPNWQAPANVWRTN
jgi:sirohydrochlorin ferrochelatase